MRPHNYSFNDSGYMQPEERSSTADFGNQNARTRLYEDYDRHAPNHATTAEKPRIESFKSQESPKAPKEETKNAHENVPTDQLNEDLEEQCSNGKYRSLRCPYSGFGNNSFEGGYHNQRTEATTFHYGMHPSEHPHPHFR